VFASSRQSSIGPRAVCRFCCLPPKMYELESLLSLFFSDIPRGLVLPRSARIPPYLLHPKCRSTFFRTPFFSTGVFESDVSFTFWNLVRLSLRYHYRYSFFFRMLQYAFRFSLRPDSANQERQAPQPPASLYFSPRTNFQLFSLKKKSVLHSLLSLRSPIPPAFVSLI